MLSLRVSELNFTSDLFRIVRWNLVTSTVNILFSSFQNWVDFIFMILPIAEGFPWTVYEQTINDECWSWLIQLIHTLAILFERIPSKGRGEERGKRRIGMESH